MHCSLRPVFVFVFIVTLILSPFFISGSNSSNIKVEPKPAVATIIAPIDLTPTPEVKTRAELLIEEAGSLYDSMRLKKFGLTRKAFEYAWTGYSTMLEDGQIENPEIISICDFSQSSRKKRLYVIDLDEMKVLVNTYVAHGRKSGGEFARSFSNSPESHKSSLGFYITGKSYFGQHGLALKIVGLERGINDRANARNIVIHGSDYVGDKFIKNNPFNGRSFGCPAVPEKQTRKIINTIKDGTCLFIYHPTKNYLAKSKLLKG